MNFQGLKSGAPTLRQEQQLAQLKEIYEVLNTRVNVISRKDMDNFFLHHVMHSLAIAHIFSFRDGSQIMDLGTGGGFPGIPLAIILPQVHFHLVDSIGKKINVVQEVAARLSLKNVTAEHSRAEMIGNRKFDGVVSRAVAPLRQLWQWSAPSLRHSQNGYGIICLKGGDLKAETLDLKRPVKQWPIFENIYQEEWFREKYILQIKP